MFESVQSLLTEHAELETQLSEPDLHSDPARSKRINRRYAELSRVVAAYHVWRKLTDDVEAATEMAELDEAFAAELPGLTDELAVAELMHRMAGFVDTGANVYSLAEASHDQYLALLVQRAAENGSETESARMPWTGWERTSG